MPFGAEGRVGGCLWRDGFRLDEAIRPPFVTPALAETLLRAGKSLNFLRECCGDATFEQSLATSQLAAAAAQLSHGKVTSTRFLAVPTLHPCSHRKVFAIFPKRRSVQQSHSCVLKSA